MLRLVGVLGLSAMVFSTSSAAARPVDLPTRLSSVIPKAAASGLPVLLPSSIDLDYKTSGVLYADGSGSKAGREYALGLSATKRCGANVCFLAEFTGERGKPLESKANVTLAHGLRGSYFPLSCGASCSPPSIEWIEKGVRYAIQAKALGGRKAFVAMADSAIRAGNRG